MKTTVSTKGQLLLPVEIYERNGIEPGQVTLRGSSIHTLPVKHWPDE